MKGYLIIGTGNMGSALLSGMINSGEFRPEDISVFDTEVVKVENAVKSYGVSGKKKIDEDIKNIDLIIISVKPDIVAEVLKEIKPFYKNQIIVSIAVGVSIDSMKKVLGKDAKIVRVMPNTPALVGEGMSAISVSSNITEDDKEHISKIFGSTGKYEYLDEKFMNDITALSGSSPAYVFMFIEAMADAAVLSGIPRDIAYKMAAQTVLGSAKMVLETGKHPASLKDQVCSPGGTTIEAVKVLEEKGFRSAVIEAMNECSKKAKQIAEGKI
jgi:pyrroline-5-carboxylate reductase